MRNFTVYRELSKTWKVIISYLFILVGLAELIFLVSNLGLSLLMSACLVHAIISTAVLIAMNYFPSKLYIHNDVPPAIFRKYPLIYYTPSFLIVVATVVLSGMSISLAGMTQRLQFDVFFTVVFLVPVVEELSYRVGIGSVLKFQLGRVLGGYFSVLVFTYMHSIPSLESLMQGHIHFFLGPFLLGIFCDLLYGWSKSIMPSIFFHSACNASAFLFQLVESKIIEFFNVLYQ